MIEGLLIIFLVVILFYTGYHMYRSDYILGMALSLLVFAVDAIVLLLILLGIIEVSL